MSATRPSCRDCLHFLDDPRLLERELPGILILSSAYGSTRGDAGICGVDEVFRLPGEACDAFAARAAEKRTGER